MTDDKSISKLLSYWLRHKPDDGGLDMDPSGWVEVDSVLSALTKRHLLIQLEDVLRVVEQSDKNRFELSPDIQLIRARQGHSISIDVGWPTQKPPAILYHGTVERFVDAIMSEGLRPMARHHVHLAEDSDTAKVVGSRRGRPVILEIAAGQLFDEGIEFRISGNGVWLVSHVPPSYLRQL